MLHVATTNVMCAVYASFFNHFLYTQKDEGILWVFQCLHISYVMCYLKVNSPRVQAFCIEKCSHTDTIKRVNAVK